MAAHRIARPGTVAAAFTLLSCLALAPDARAAQQLELSPSVSVWGGYDSNVLFDGSGGDRVGRGLLRLRLQGWDRGWRVSGDLSAGVLGFDTRQRIVPIATGTFKASWRGSRETRYHALARLRGADDPLALATLGVLAGQGPTLGYRSEVGVAHRLDRRWSLLGAVTFEGAQFFDQTSTQQGGSALGAKAGPRLRAERWLTLGANVEGRQYFQAGPLATSAGLVPDVRVRLARRTFLTGAAGALAFFDTQGTLPVPVVRVGFENTGRQHAVTLQAAHDLLVPSGRGGVVLGQLLDLVGRWGDDRFELRGRVGAYRTQADPRGGTWTPGWGAEAGAFVKVVPEVWLGVSALQFARLPAGGAPGMTREAVYLRLELGGGRP